MLDKVIEVGYSKVRRTGEGSLLSQQWLLTHLAIRIFRRTGRHFHGVRDRIIVCLRPGSFFVGCIPAFFRRGLRNCHVKGRRPIVSASCRWVFSASVSLAMSGRLYRIFRSSAALSVLRAAVFFLPSASVCATLALEDTSLVPEMEPSTSIGRCVAVSSFFVGTPCSFKVT